MPFRASFVLPLLPLLVMAAFTRAEARPFHPRGKPPSKHIVASFEAALRSLPFSHKKDFEERDRGFIAAPASMTSKADAGHDACAMGSYRFLLDGQHFDSIHPSLRHQSALNMNFGLYEVVPGFYQVRSFDPANISFVRGETGSIVFDPLNTLETTRAAKQLADEHAEDADLSIRIDRADLEQVMTGEKTRAAQIDDGTAKIEGDPSVLDQLASLLVDFELRFEVLPGTKGKGPSPEMELDPHEQGPIDLRGDRYDRRSPITGATGEDHA